MWNLEIKHTKKSWLPVLAVTGSPGSDMELHKRNLCRPLFHLRTHVCRLCLSMRPWSEVQPSVITARLIRPRAFKQINKNVISQFCRHVMTYQLVTSISTCHSIVLHPQVGSVILPFSPGSRSHPQGWPLYIGREQSLDTRKKQPFA